MYLGSDALALAPLTDRVAHLKDGDWVVVTREGADIRDALAGRSSGYVKRDLPLPKISKSAIYS